MKKIPSTAIAAIGLAGLVAAGFLEPLLTRMRPGQQENTVLTAPQNASPLVVFTTVALGGFRGLAIDLLWARVNILQDEGDYVEIAQLSDWITKLNPLLPAVWDFHSFNMAYNISAMSSSPQDRWHWIASGIRMLRDEALVYNPHEPMLCDRLCRIYKHKMVDRAEAGRMYYRVAWAQEMTELFGGPGPDFHKLTTEPQSALRLRNDYKLDPAVMMDVDKTYGPVDWRLPESHILYWATRGIRESVSSTNLSFDLMICETMSEVFMNGRIVDFRPADNILATDIRSDLLSKTLVTLETAASDRGYSLTAETGFGGFYRNFLRRALVLLADKELNKEADTVFVVLRDKLHDKGTDRPLSEYIAAIRPAQRHSIPR